MSSEKLLQLHTSFRSEVSVVSIATDGTGSVLLDIKGIKTFTIVQLNALKGKMIDVSFLYMPPEVTGLEELNETF